MVKHLDDRHMTADAVEIGSHLESDNSAADNDESARNLLHIKNLVIGESEAALDRLAQPGNRRDRCGRACADEQLTSDILAVARADNKALRVAAQYLARLGHYIYARALQRRADAADEHLDHLILALDNIAVVYRGVSELYAVLGTVLGVIEYLSRIEQRFCRNTALVQAYTAERSLFDNEGLESPMCGALRRIISGGTSANDCYIKFHTLIVFK